MSEMIAYCGLDCAKCDVFLATQAGDAAQKAKIAERWANQLKMEFTQEDITCDGCKSDKISAWCQRVCKIRPCAEVRDVSTCASCTDYMCENLDVFLAGEPEARITLEEMRRIV
ncbi:MAG: DUF3795 domain-containing protein [Candidatus Thorarchaeota archaeon]